MSDFDLAVGISGNELNTASGTVYASLYPNLFTGSTTDTYQGVSYTITWDVQAAPQFDLAPGPTSFAVTFSTVAMTFQTGTSPASQLTLSFTADCSVNITGNTLTFSVSQVTAPTQSDPVQNYFVQNVVVPAILALSQQLLSAITIPPLQVEGVSLTSPAAGIVGDALIATANVTSSGPPAPPDNTIDWPGSDFFALLGPNLLQALANEIVSAGANQFSGSSSGSDYSWSYSLAFADPQISIGGGGLFEPPLTITFNLTGSVSAQVDTFLGNADVNYAISTSPAPAIMAALELQYSPQGSQIYVIPQSVSPFFVNLTVIGNSFSSLLLSTFLEPIASMIIQQASPSLFGYLQQIQIPSLSVPSYSISLEGQQFTITPVAVFMETISGDVALMGPLQITEGEMSEAAPWRKSA